MSDTTSSGGIGFIGLLQIVFITLKLCGVITWPWIWVLSPIWIGIIIFIAAFILGFAIFGTIALIQAKKRSRLK